MQPAATSLKKTAERSTPRQVSWVVWLVRWCLSARRQHRDSPEELARGYIDIDIALADDTIADMRRQGRFV
jgi:hypothetical protein